MTSPPKAAVLTGKQKSYLRALAHSSKPVVQIGHGGLTDSVLKAIDGALHTHELIKVRVVGNEELSASELAPEIEQRTRLVVVQVIGKTLVVYRGRKKDPVIVLPTPGAAAKRSKKSAKAKPANEE